MSILDDVAAYIEANTTGWTVGTNGTILHTTDAQVDRVYERPNIQALSRSTSPTVARDNVDRIYDLLDGLANTTMSGTRYLEFVAVQAPFQLGRDDNQRHLWSVNFNVKKDIS